MLYSRYSSPLDLVDRYIKQRRFGKFVQGFFEAEYERKKQAIERDRELMLWIAYVMASVHGLYNGTFDEYKKSCATSANTSGAKSTASMTDNDIKELYIKFFGAPEPQE